MKRLSVKIVVATAALTVVTFFAWTFAARSREGAEKQEKEPPSQPTPSGGAAGVTLDSQTQARMGIVVTNLAAMSQREELRAPASVLSAQDLIDLRNSYAATTAKVQKARLSADVSRKEYDRLKALYQDNQNASQKSLQSAEATLRSNEVDAQAAEQELRLVKDAARQRWGEAVATWLTDGSPRFGPLLQQSEFLIQVTLPPDKKVSPPPIAIVEGSSSGLLRAELVSTFPRLDPRIQGLSLLYITSAGHGLTPGMNLTARLPVGRRVSGVVVPESAVVWWLGKAWAYLQVDARRFIRREVPTEAAVRNGWFAAQGFAPGEKIVVTGAQALLSAELRPRPATEEKKGEQPEEKD